MKKKLKNFFYGEKKIFFWGKQKVSIMKKKNQRIFFLWQVEGKYSKTEKKINFFVTNGRKYSKKKSIFFCGKRKVSIVKKIL